MGRPMAIKGRDANGQEESEKVTNGGTVGHASFGEG